MIIITTLRRLYGKKIITDLALRRGSDTENDYSPYDGMNAIVNNYYRGESLASLEYLYQKQKDFDADIMQPHIDVLSDYSRQEEREEYELTTEYNPAKDKANFKEYNRRLEDINQGYLEDYMSNLVYTVFVLSGSGGAIDYDYNHKLQPTLVSVEDDGVTELADLQLQGDEHSYTESAKAKAKEQLPYVIKRLHNLSCYCGIHMLSMISAYMKAKRENALRQQTGSTMSLKKNAVIAKGVYKCDTYGNIGDKIEVANKNQKAAHMFDWLHGLNNDYPSYKEDYLNFVLYCEMLNIDLYNDDFTKYDKKFVDSLVVTTLTPNHQYNQAVFDAIRDSGIESTEEVDPCLETMENFRDLCVSNEVLQKVIENHTKACAKDNLKVATALHSYQSIMLDNLPVPELKYYSWQNGFLYYKGELVILNTRLVCDDSYYDPRVIISELGFCIHVSTNMALECMTVYVAEENMKSKYIEHDHSAMSKWSILV